MIRIQSGTQEKIFPNMPTHACAKKHDWKKDLFINIVYYGLYCAIDYILMSFSVYGHLYIHIQ